MVTAASGDETTGTPPLQPQAAPGDIAQEVTGLAGDCAAASARLQRPAPGGRPDAAAALAVLADIAARLSALAAALIPVAWQAEAAVQDLARQWDAGFAAGLAAGAGRRDAAARLRARQLVADAHWLEARMAVTVQHARERREAVGRLRSVPPPQ